MAKPYQDLQGNWFIAGRPMSQQEVAMQQVVAANIPKPAAAPAHPATQAQQVQQVAQAPAPDPIAVEQRRQAEMRQMGLNPMGAGMDFLKKSFGF